MNKKDFYELREYEAVAGKQQFNYLPFIQEGMG